MVDQIRLRTLLKEDEGFREWFMKPPTITVGSSPTPWRLYVQMVPGGPWARGDLRSYAKAYAQVKLRLPDAWDMTIHSRPQHFKPPIFKKGAKKFWMPMPDGHHWCELCRRPVVMRGFKKHPALKYQSNPEERRCTICGMRAEAMKEYRSPLSWPAPLVR